MERTHNRKEVQDAKEVGARSQRLDIYEGLNKVTLVPAGATTGKRGKGAGFYCQDCDLTFKDSIQYTDHLNSKQHLYALGQRESTRRATLEDVKRRLEMLKKKKLEQEKPMEFDIKKRIAERKRIEELEAQARRERRKNKKMKQKDEPVNDKNDMAAMMGFSGFGSSKH